MVNLVELLVRHGADVDSLATEIAFSDSEQYRTSSPLCQAAKVDKNIKNMLTINKYMYYIILERLLGGGWEADIHWS